MPPPPAQDVNDLPTEAQATKEPSNGVWTLNVTVSVATSIVQVDLPFYDRNQPVTCTPAQICQWVTSAAECVSLSRRSRSP